jgi:hypothetical protein
VLQSFSEQSIVDYKNIEDKKPQNPIKKTSPPRGRACLQWEIAGSPFPKEQTRNNLYPTASEATKVWNF